MLPGNIVVHDMIARRVRDLDVASFTPTVSTECLRRPNTDVSE